MLPLRDAHCKRDKRRMVDPMRSASWFQLVILVLLTGTLCVRAAEPLAQQGQNGNNNAAGNAGGAGAAANTSLASSSATAIPSSAAAGGITITEPQQTAAQSYFKIAQGISVTFGWNFTSVLKYPSSLLVQAFCSENSNTYTLAPSLAGTATGFIWAPYDYDQSAALSGHPQLIAATYRLQIMDERGLNVGAQAGLFQPNTKVQFALYQPKPYQPISEGWRCDGCASSSSTARFRQPRAVALMLLSPLISALLIGAT